jgi:hypothetical protein
MVRRSDPGAGIGYLSPVRTILASPVLLALALLACHPSPDPAEPNKTTTTGADPVVEPDGGKPVKADEVTLSPTQTAVTVAVGTKLLFSYTQWASVGLWAEQKIADEAVVRYVRTDEVFAQPGPDRPPGGDRATGTFVFEAAAPGTTTVQIDESDKGTVTKSTTFTITVTAP